MSDQDDPDVIDLGSGFTDFLQEIADRLDRLETRVAELERKAEGD
jgi:hypothetical protein